MIALDFRDLVRSLCEHTGVDAWETVLAEREIDIDGVTVGLIHDEDRSPHSLGLFFDLGDWTADADVMARLLDFNVEAAAGEGRMGRLASSRRIVYRVELPWTEPMDGVQLETHLRAHLDIARGGWFTARGLDQPIDTEPTRRACRC
jgi:hypothetical protein